MSRRTPRIPPRRLLPATLLAVAAVLAAGCASAPAPAPAPFQPSDVAWSRAAGTATVEGRAEVRARGGALHTCAGGEAQLVPASPYATRMMAALFGNDRKGYVTLASSPRFPTDMPDEFKHSVRRAPCDAAGDFRFEAVPAGEWYVFSNVVWRDDGGSDGLPGGGPLMRRIETSPQATTRVVLAP